MRPVVVYGGINTGYTIREVLKGCNVLCGTPGRLLDIIGRGKVIHLLTGTKYCRSAYP